MALGALLLASAAATAVGEAASPFASREAALAAIRSEIAQLEDRIVEKQADESGLEQELAKISLELELQEVRLAEAAAARDLAAARAEAAEERVGELGKALEEIRRTLRRRLAGLYRLGQGGYLRLFLSLEPEAGLLPAIRQLRYLARRDRQTLELYRQTRDQLTVERRVLARERQEAESWHRQEASRRRELATVRRRHERLLAGVARERRALVARAQALEEKQRKLSRLIESLVASGSEGGEVLSGTPIADFRGVLDWPIRGEVAEGFGLLRDPRYQTEVPHHGVDIASAGGDVKAIYPGEVLFAAPFEGYGPMVVIHHPGRVFTLYAGLAEIGVAEGDVVALGTVLGSVAGRLYFEIRSDQRPEDPLGWLR